MFRCCWGLGAIRPIEGHERACQIGCQTEKKGLRILIHLLTFETELSNPSGLHCISLAFRINQTHLPPYRQVLVSSALSFEVIQGCRSQSQTLLHILLRILCTDCTLLLCR